MSPWIQLLSAGWAAFLGPLAVLLSLTAVIWDGRLFGLAGVLWAALPLLASWGRPRAIPRRRTVAFAVLIAATLLTLTVMVHAPLGPVSSHAKLQRIPTNPTGLSERCGLGRFLPEVDQLMPGFTLAMVLDPLFTHSQCTELKQLTKDIYRELEADADFRAAGSLMPDAYLRMLGHRPLVAESFLYISPNADRTRPLPVIVFLHGSGGNLKSYIWVLSRVADRLGALIVAPSGGMGSWSNGEAAAAIDQALASLPAGLQIDSASIHVVGLSNGSRGVTQLLQAAPRRFRSFVFISPVFDEQALESLAFTSGDYGPDALVISGSLDDRVPLTYVAESVKRLSGRNVRVDLRVIEGATHFAMFSHRAHITDSLGAWFSARRATP